MTKKTQRMRPPSGESARMADEARRHRETIEMMKRLELAIARNSLATITAAAMAKARGGIIRRDDRVENLELIIQEALDAMGFGPIPRGDVDDTS